jgi:hypothetical protein
VHQYNQMYWCSVHVHIKYWILRGLTSGENNEMPHYKTPLKKHTCIYCQQEYENERHVSSFCSNACRNKNSRLLKTSVYARHKKLKQEKLVKRYLLTRKELLELCRKRNKNKQLVEITPRTWVLVKKGKSAARVQKHVSTYLNDNKAQH